ncbi:MAG: acetyl-CoA carboxylase biotin carboxyl carrier protein subunit [bacterium]|jgi:pyruvate carboxylase subunit B|nr:acetyl-CoA carboxylase biotin carboxyl carrier protein subunit [candidate division KSB1 bacterium]MDH7559206.1 acetyl-CoA carboxylase biotin carboxyl carrier protein subunit [bacterium]
MRYRAEIDGHELEFDLRCQGHCATAIVDGTVVPITMTRIGSSTEYAVLFGNRSFSFEVQRNAAGTWVAHCGRVYHCRAQNAQREALARLGGAAEGHQRAWELRAPMPGLVLEVRVREGDAVEAGQGVLVVEAMKMENELRAPCAGTVKEVKVKEKESVEQNQLLIVFA